ncbi:GerAB/ArcD/ProY family transporter [Rossellomorea sp. YZS02]|uniref:GerAB/ArcD/ProY family transporter n=1 Tax=Rossellomorea sp. YZS02 TaxID=3097358 RepID=UPI002A175F7C|nr:GerAB/ArcD/ProY family transporter [Rossellomorea sp. YZS02]MDX8343309.1 GerAB/ArcD/ProY family transporter [Rossellomorea sp. YZS02]
MLMKEDRRIRTREFIAIILLILGIKFTDMTATILFKETTTATWMIPVISAVSFVVPLSAILSLVKKFGEINLIEIAFQVTGKYIGFLIGMLLFLIAFSSTIVNTRGYVDIITSMYFQESTNLSFYILLVGSSYYLANRGLLAIGRTAWICIPYIKFSLLFAIILLWNKLYFQHLFPILGPGLKPLVMEGVKYSSISGDILYMAMIFPFVKGYPAFRKGILIGYGLAVLELSLFFAFFIAFFDYPTFEFIAYPFHEILRMIKLGRFVSNIESLFFAFWSVASIIRFSFYLYISALVLSATLKIKEFEPLLLPLAALTVIIGIMPENNIKNMLYLRGDFILTSSSLLLFFIPIFIYLVAKGKEVFKSEKN